MEPIIEMAVDSLNGMKEEAPEWEELEVMVDSGAGVSVVGRDNAEAAHMSEGGPARNYKRADGIIIQNKGKIASWRRFSMGRCSEPTPT